MSPDRAEQAPSWDAMALVGRVARPHGLRGQVVVNSETDFMEDRFRVGSSVYALRDGDVRELRIEGVRFQRGRPVLTFAEISRLEEVSWLAGQELRVPVAALPELPGGQFYRHDLVGCVVTTADGTSVGTVVDVEGPAAASRLVVDRQGEEVLVPVAAEICVTIDVEGRRIVIDPPEGLLELNAG